MTDNIRYDRQGRIQNWQQERLTNARVAIVGTGQLAQFTAASLAALGIGRIELYARDSQEGFLTTLGRTEGSATESLESMLRKMNPEVEIKVNSGENNDYLANKPDLVLDLTNTPESKAEVLARASQNRVRVISASTNKTGGELYFINPSEQISGSDLQRYDSEPQGDFSSMVFGGMITEEVRKVLMPLDDKEKPVRVLGYNATSEKRFTRESEFEAQPYEDLSKKRVLVIGAGALGNFVALGAALEGVGKIDILDFDDVEAHNLNRQVMFYDSVGKLKSTALAEKIRRINPNAEVNGLVGKLDENSTIIESGKYDVILDCVDSLATRAITNYFAVRYGIPLVSGGTNSSSGQVVVYEPGNSACIECKLGVERALATALQGSKCTKQTDPSVVMTNEIIGGMMVGETLKVLDRGYGTPVSKMLKYDSKAPVRGGVLGSSEPCGCTRGEMKDWLQEVKDRFSFMGDLK